MSDQHSIDHSAPPHNSALTRGAFRCALAVGFVLLFSAPVLAGAVHRSVAGVTASSGVAQSPSWVCGQCHSAEFSLWIAHPHSHFLIDPEQDPRLVRAVWTAGAPGWADGSAPRFAHEEVALVYGLLQVQVFFRRDTDGHRLLPAQWNLNAGRWEPLAEELEQFRKQKNTWEQGCAGCHVTDFDASDGSFAERNVGCRACHGDGDEHVAKGGLGPIVSPAKLSGPRRTDLCGSCHARGTAKGGKWPFPVDFAPGRALAEVFDLKQPRPGWMDTWFWSDGTERLPYTEYQGFLQSGHAREGLSCTTCHAAHGSDNPFQLRRSTSELCRGCHAPAGLSSVHRGHPKGEVDCVGCHMSVTDRDPRQFHVHTHTFRVLDPGYALQTGMPSSCTSECHHGRNLRWANGALQSWRQAE